MSRRKREVEDNKCYTATCEEPSVYPEDNPAYCERCAKCPRCPDRRGIISSPNSTKVYLRSVCNPCYREGRGLGRKRRSRRLDDDDDKTEDDKEKEKEEDDSKETETETQEMGPVERAFADILEARAKEAKKFQGSSKQVTNCC